MFSSTETWHSPANSVRQLLWQANRSTMFYLYVVKKQNLMCSNPTSLFTLLCGQNFHLRLAVFKEPQETRTSFHTRKNSWKLNEFRLDFVLNIRVCKNARKVLPLNFECIERVVGGFGAVASSGWKAWSARTEVPQVDLVCSGPYRYISYWRRIITKTRISDDSLKS